METQLKKPSTNSVGNWTPDEDEVILKYVYEKGKSDEHMMWGNLSETLNGRSGKSCRERWFNHLDPKIKRTEWSQEEQWVLFILRNQSQEKWSLISKKLMGRTDNAVKNYWNSRLKKRIDSMQHAVNQHFERKRKQKIALITQATGDDAGGEQKLSDEQLSELSAYMDRIKAEYLQKILDQVNNQNVEYFENLACEYTLQLQLLLAGEKAEEVVEEDNEDSQRQAISFINKPEVIKMHLDILYKSITFLSRERIASILESYKKNKEKKRREEQERIQMQMQMKKSRGRQSSKRDKDDDAAEPRLAKPSEPDDHAKSKSARFAPSLKTGCPARQGSSQKEVALKAGVGSKANGHSATGFESGDPKLASKIKKNPQISLNSSFADGKERCVSSGKTAGEERDDEEMEDLTQSNGEENHSAEASSSSSSSVSVQSQNVVTRRGLRMQKCLGLKKIMKKLKKQKRQFKMMDKIFVFRKEDRDPSQSGSKDPLLLRSNSPTPQDDPDTISDDSTSRDGKRVRFKVNSQPSKGGGSPNGTPKKSQPSQRLHMKLRNSKCPSRRHGAEAEEGGDSKPSASSKPTVKKNLPIQKKPIGKYEVRKLNLVKPHMQDRKKRAKQLENPSSEEPSQPYFQQISGFPEGIVNNPTVMQAVSSGIVSGAEAKSLVVSHSSTGQDDQDKTQPPSMNFVTNLIFINNGDSQMPSMPQVTQMSHLSKPMAQPPSFGTNPIDPSFQTFDQQQLFGQQPNFTFQQGPFVPGGNSFPMSQFSQPPLQKSHSIPVPTTEVQRNPQSDLTASAEQESAQFGQNEASDLVPPVQRVSDCIIQPVSTSSRSRDNKQTNPGSLGRRTVRSHSKKLPRKRDNFGTNNFFNQTMTQISQMVGKKHKGPGGLALRKKSSLTRAIPHVTPKDSNSNLPFIQPGLQHSYSFGNFEGLQHQTYMGEFGTPEMKKPENPVHIRSELIMKEAFGLPAGIPTSQTPKVNHKNLPDLGSSPALAKAVSATSGLTFGQFPKEAVASGLAPQGKPSPLMESGGSGFHRLSDDIGRNEYSADFLSKMKKDSQMVNEE